MSQAQRAQIKLVATGLFGVIALILVIGFSFIVASMVTYAVPSSAQWTSGIMCSSPYQLQGSHVPTEGPYVGQTSSCASVRRIPS